MKFQISYFSSGPIVAGDIFLAALDLLRSDQLHSLRNHLLWFSSRLCEVQGTRFEKGVVPDGVWCPSHVRLEGIGINFWINLNMILCEFKDFSYK